MGDDLARQRRELPWVRVDEQYTLETESGPKTYRERMGWSFTWVSSCESGFHFDYGVSATAQTAQGSVALFLRGTRVSTFTRLDDAIYHCYSSYARGTEFLMGYYAILDRAPKGRDEGDQPMSWLRRHDEYAQ